MTEHHVKRPWSGNDVAELEKLVSQGADKRQIAALLGRTVQAIEAKLYRRGEDVKGRPAAIRNARKRRSNGASFFLS